MSRVSLHVSVREEIRDKLEVDRGLISLSRYVDTLLGIIYGMDDPNILPARPPGLQELVELRIKKYG